MDRRLLIVILLSLSFLSMYGAHRVNTWNGDIKVTNVVIPGENTVTGVLYEPNEITGQTTGVLLAHGISNSKEPFSGAALELAKHGYVALSIDLFGHGRSSGSLDTGDPSLGVVQAARFLAELPFVADEIGLVGHSLGAGVSHIASINVSEAGLVLIGGGIGQNPYSILDEMDQPSMSSSSSDVTTCYST